MWRIILTLGGKKRNKIQEARFGNGRKLKKEKKKKKKKKVEKDFSVEQDFN